MELEPAPSGTKTGSRAPCEDSSLHNAPALLMAWPVRTLPVSLPMRRRNRPIFLVFEGANRGLFRLATYTGIVPEHLVTDLPSKVRIACSATPRALRKRVL